MTAARGYHALVLWVLASRLLSLLQEHCRVRPEPVQSGGWHLEVSLAITLLSCCREMLVAAARPAGQDGPGSVGVTLCPCVQRSMAGLSPGLFSLEDAGGIRD